jgi:hypothetical protein
MGPKALLCKKRRKNKQPKIKRKSEKLLIAKPFSDDCLERKKSLLSKKSEHWGLFPLTDNYTLCSNPFSLVPPKNEEKKNP